MFEIGLGRVSVGVDRISVDVDGGFVGVDRVAVCYIKVCIRLS